jgi:hypothetical protein
MRTAAVVFASGLRSTHYMFLFKVIDRSIIFLLSLVMMMMMLWQQQI